MRKETDKLLWQLGKKQNTMTNQEAYREYLMRRAVEKNPSTRIKKFSTKF